MRTASPCDLGKGHQWFILDGPVKDGQMCACGKSRFTSPDPLALADQLAAAVAAYQRRVDAFNDEVPICDIPLPTDGREYESLTTALAAYQAARGTAYPAPSTESGFHEP